MQVSPQFGICDKWVNRNQSINLFLRLCGDVALSEEVPCHEDPSQK